MAASNPVRSTILQLWHNVPHISGGMTKGHSQDNQLSERDLGLLVTIIVYPRPSS
jgi:hypothetical protein